MISMDDIEAFKNMQHYEYMANNYHKNIKDDYNKVSKDVGGKPLTKED